jgi:hypothetical protein
LSGLVGAANSLSAAYQILAMTSIAHYREFGGPAAWTVDLDRAIFPLANATITALGEADCPFGRNQRLLKGRNRFFLFVF